MVAHEHHHPVSISEADWSAMATDTEREGEVFLGFVTAAAQRVRELRATGPVRSLIDIGSGPGVGSCELARQFPAAAVVAVDASPGMLERARRRADAHGLAHRVRTHLAELPDGLEALGRADVIWASLSLHHVGDEVAALRALRGVLADDGLLAVAEMAAPMRVLPDDLDIGRAGLVARLDYAGTPWFAAMRAGLPDSVPSEELPTMLAKAGFEVLSSEVVHERIEPPLSQAARQVALGHLHRLARHLSGHLDREDLEALALLSDPDDPRGVMHRRDVFLEWSRLLVVARPR